MGNIDLTLTAQSEKITIEPGFYPRLSFKTEFSSTRGNGNIEGLTGRLYLEDGEDSIFVGSLKPRMGKTHSIGNNNTAYSTLELELPNQKIERLEEIRGKGDLEFKISVTAKCREGNRDNFKKLESKTAETTVKVFQSQWLNLLERSMFSEVNVYEIPEPAELNENGELAEAHQLLSEGFRKYRNRNNPMNSCRMAVENLNKVIDDADIDKTTKEAIEDLLSYTQRYLSMGSHNDSGEREEGQKQSYGIPASGIDGSDWLMGLRLTASAYQRIAEAIEE